MFTYILHSIDTQPLAHLDTELDVRKDHVRFNLTHKLDLPLYRTQLQQDINLIPSGFDAKRVKLFVSDMDSTLITIECIDEIAAFAGVQHEVARITERAMQGELNFKTALYERVALLKNVSVDSLQRVYDERLRLSPGSAVFIDYLKQRGVKCALVSGGFTFFTKRLQTQLTLDDTLANELTIDNNTLTGEINGEVVDTAAKAVFIEQLADKYHIPLADTLAIGDGANDIELLKRAGLSIAYHAKDSLKQHADIVIDYGDFSTLLHLFDE